LKILFVCTGNTCRSSMAEALARKILAERPEGKGRLEFSSAGVAALTGNRASLEAVEALAGMGVDLRDHRATLLTPGIISEADLILTMTRAHREHILEIFPSAAGKVFTLAEYAGAAGDVPDPIGQPVEVYRSCAERLKDLIARAIDRLREKERGFFERN